MTHRTITLTIPDQPSKTDETAMLSILARWLPDGYLRDMLVTLRPLFEADVASDFPTDGAAALRGLQDRADKIRAELAAADRALLAKRGELRQVELAVNQVRAELVKARDLADETAAYLAILAKRAM